MIHVQFSMNERITFHRKTRISSTEPKEDKLTLQKGMTFLSCRIKSARLKKLNLTRIKQLFIDAVGSTAIEYQSSACFQFPVRLIYFFVVEIRDSRVSTFLVAAMKRYNPSMKKMRSSSSRALLRALQG